MDSLMFLSGEESKLVMKNLCFCLVFLLCFLLSFKLHSAEARNTSLVTTNTTSFHVGVIVNLNSTAGMVANITISMAVSDFNAVHRNSSYKLLLHVRDSKGEVTKAASAALDLIENIGVQAILGPETSEEAEFIAYMGNKVHVPIITFSPITLSVTGNRFPYFVQLAQKESSQVNAIVSIVQAYKWREVSIIHDDSQSGTTILYPLTDALHAIGVLVPVKTVLPLNANGKEINDTLNKMNDTNIRVFIVHLSISLATRFFLNVNQANMMQAGYAWITTCQLTNQLSAYMPSSAFQSMRGVIGLKTYVPPSKALSNFRIRWRRQVKAQGLKSQISGPNVYALWAYDAIYLIAMAANKAGFDLQRNLEAAPNNSTLAKNSMDLLDTAVSPIGSELLRTVLTIHFTGLSGEVQLVEKKLQSSSFEIVNVRKRSYYKIGYWTGKGVLCQSLSSCKDNNNKLGVVIWPGGSKDVPPAKILRVGVPVKTGFLEFMNVTGAGTPHFTVQGFSKDVFEEVMRSFGYKFRYEPYGKDGTAAGYYDNLTNQVYLGKYDVVVGDVTILASRAEYVSFTPPYTVTGLRMIVLTQHEEFLNNTWWFLEPLEWKLWFTTIAFFLWKGILIWMFEHGTNPEFQGPFLQQLGKILHFSFSIFVFAHREKLESNYSRFIVDIWIFGVFVLVTSYNSQLTAMLAFGYQKATETSLASLQRNGHSVGHQGGSFVFDLLKKKGFNDNQIKNLSTTKDYADALSNGTVSAIVDDIPYIDLFLSQYCSNFTVIGEIYQSGGLGFVFPKYSPLLSDVAKEVLKLIEEKRLDEIKGNWSMNYSCQNTLQDPLKANISSTQLRLKNFGSIYTILAITSTFAFLAFFVSFLYNRALQAGTALGRDSLPDDVKDNDQPSQGVELQEFNEPPSDTDEESILAVANEEPLREATQNNESASDQVNTNEIGPTVQGN